MSESSTLLDESVLVDVDVNDPVNTHIIDCPDDKDSAEAWLTEARVFGLEVTALCGHRWIPQSDPMKHPICEPCVEEAQRRVQEANGG